jgi:hypothetical protein
MNAPRPMLPLTRVHTSDLEPSEFVELAPPWPVGLLNRPIDTSTEFAARGPDRSTARPKRSMRRKRSLAAPAAHTLTATLPMTDVAIGGTAADRRFRDRNTFGKDSVLGATPDAAMFREPTSAMGQKAPF